MAEPSSRGGLLPPTLAGNPARLQPIPVVLLLALTLACGLACGVPEPFTACEPGGGLEPICGFENPEDLVRIPGSGWLLISEMAPMGRSEGDPGRLVAYHPQDAVRRPLYPRPDKEAGSPDPALAGDPDCPGPPDPNSFAPHGVDLSPDGRRLAAVNHGGRESIELFALGSDAAGPTLAWQGCLLLPGESFGNDLVILPDGGIVVSNMLPRDPGLLENLRMLARRDTGSLLHWAPGAGWSEVAGSQTSTPNGVEVSADGQTLYFTAWLTRRLVAIPTGGGTSRSVELGVRGDNLSWDGSGRLLVTGQDTGLSELVGCASRKEGTCAIGFSVLGVDPESLEAEPIFSHDGRAVFGAASITVEAPGGYWIGSFGADRIAWLPTPDPSRSTTP